MIDTSTLVSAALRPGSIPDQVLTAALSPYELCASAETLDELARVLDRSKFDRYRDRESRREFVETIRDRAQCFEVEDAGPNSIDPPCRDISDNRILLLARAADAYLIVSSDSDLLVLHPWRGIPIVTPADFLAGAAPALTAE